MVAYYCLTHGNHVMMLVEAERRRTETDLSLCGRPNQMNTALRWIQFVGAFRISLHLQLMAFVVIGNQTREAGISNIPQ